MNTRVVLLAFATAALASAADANFGLIGIGTVPQGLCQFREISHYIRAAWDRGAKLNDDGSDGGGGIYIVDVDTREAARALIEADPFFTAGLFADIRIVRWRKAYLDGVCHL